MEKKINKLKISVHIPFYFDESKNKKIKNLNKICNTYLKLSSKTKIFIHTNKKRISDNKRVKFIYHNLTNKHPFELTWFPRRLMKNQAYKYDIFIYSEDDILFSKKNLEYWLKNKDICIKNNYNLGFLRVEKNKDLYAIDQIKKLKFYKTIDKNKFIVIENPYCAFWIYDKKEFNKFVKTKYYNFKWKFLKIGNVNLTREMSAIGWHGYDFKKGFNMGHYIASIIPIKRSLLDKNSFIYHTSSNYSKNPAGLFGTFKVNDLLEKILIKFKQPTFFEKSINKTLFYLYSLFRINFKNFRRKKTKH